MDDRSMHTPSRSRAMLAGAVAGVLGGSIAVLYAGVAARFAGAPQFEQLAPAALFVVAVLLNLLGGWLFYQLDLMAHKPATTFSIIALVAAVGASLLVIAAMPMGFGRIAHGVNFLVAMVAALLVPWLAGARRIQRTT